MTWALSKKSALQFSGPTKEEVIKFILLLLVLTWGHLKCVPHDNKLTVVSDPGSSSKLIAMYVYSLALVSSREWLKNTFLSLLHCYQFSSWWFWYIKDHIKGPYSSGSLLANHSQWVWWLLIKMLASDDLCHFLINLLPLPIPQFFAISSNPRDWGRQEHHGYSTPLE